MVRTGAAPSRNENLMTQFASASAMPRINPETVAATYTREALIAATPGLITANAVITTENECGWFALCDNEPSYLISHPINRDGIPVCKPCYVKLDELSDGRIVDDVMATR
jgi:hypothetical protein